jgi:hypothetical protein
MALRIHHRLICNPPYVMDVRCEGTAGTGRWRTASLGKGG